ncbi:type II toxin-antitoxin system ParD family antitoxin [Laspinema olomoucense]|uniref:type II toxin-antitoxin system ParD family antitoxin n=1 Tax=Laspinema olomoucense TaxID=3231600 RepID=UPI0021BB8CF8|nr:type II toxin-antitoxin system ParD family antitoxin [Laspinema sp. D3c]MCT7994059.1 type II toxin-antitoxin system ParD family antitoxin [Laspinema sp. D3c]
MINDKSQDEVVAALYLLEDREKRYQETLGQLQEKITAGIESLDRGEGIDGETALQKLREKIISRSQDQ